MANGRSTGGKPEMSTRRWPGGLGEGGEVTGRYWWGRCRPEACHVRRWPCCGPAMPGGTDLALRLGHIHTPHFTCLVCEVGTAWPHAAVTAAAHVSSECQEVRTGSLLDTQQEDLEGGGRGSWQPGLGTALSTWTLEQRPGRPAVRVP